MLFHMVCRFLCDSSGRGFLHTLPDSQDFLVTGDVVNVAARLQQNAEPGHILVGERTKSAGQTAFHFATMREINVRGKAQTLKVYTLEGSRITIAL